MTKKQKILVAENNIKFQGVMRLILERHGFEVMVCSDGIEAKKAIDQNPVDLIISDYMMPNMDGLQLLKALKKEGKDIPFILITGNVRQLENTIKSAVAMCDSNMIKVADLPMEVRLLLSEKDSDSNEYQGSLTQFVSKVERLMIQKALDKNRQIKARAARDLGISERILSYKIKKYRIKIK